MKLTRKVWSCHLLKGHSEHRTNEWKSQEVLRSCVQALEGRCSHRSNSLHDQKKAVKEFVAKIEVILLNQLSANLERQNEPDRRLISRINRSLNSLEMQDSRPSIYHIPSPSRPAYKTWNLNHADPGRMAQLVEMTAEILQLPRQRELEEEREFLKNPREWDSKQAASLISASIGLPTSDFASRCSTPAHSEQRRRGNSVDSHVPLEPSVFVRDRPSVTSFRERSTSTDENEVISPAFSQFSLHSTPSTAVSSLPAYPESSQASATSQTVTPVPSMAAGREASDHDDRSFGKNFLTRPICVHAFNTRSRPEQLAVTDSCGGVYITEMDGTVNEHILIKNSSASSICVDEKNDLMYVSIMQSKGRSVHVFDISENFRKIDVIACPKDPKIEMSRTRWITVDPRGHLFMCSGDNVKSALWTYVRSKKAWKTLKESRKTRYQYLSVAEDQAEYKAVVLLTCDAATNRLLLFVVDHTMSLINEYDLSKTYRLSEHISSPASAIVDKNGNLLILDYANGKVWILLSGVKGIRRLKQVPMTPPLKSQEALGICAKGDFILLALFNRREVRQTRYLENGVFHAAASSSPALTQKRSSSLPRPSESRL
ncbi:unnamed protein product [Caenorhabditis auriculariae]|uniref:Uncharacterized protein n=1 Tax=Caenorhabditis auriculariae TaxID=2777116 RepID=A0A8S1GMD4_9PELO|nr:unnamed protein product [Caenorhabditis auriculariae]